MLVTLCATLRVLKMFGIFYLVMRLTHEHGIDYEAVDYATQDPRALFLSQTILGVLGAVMDEATDIVSSLYALAKHKVDLTFKELFLSGQDMTRKQAINKCISVDFYGRSSANDNFVSKR